MTSLYRRATDLIPFDTARSASIQVRSQDDSARILNELEDQLFTGSIKVFCDARKSRAGALIWKGKVLGCVYVSQTHLSPASTEDSLQLMLGDCGVPGTRFMKSPLTEHIVLPMSSLFLGYPVERDDSLTASGYLQYIKNWFQSKRQTACIAISPLPNQTAFDFVLKGVPVGTFEVELQRYSPAHSAGTRGDHLARSYPTARIQCSILPPDGIDKIAFRLTNRRTH